LFARIPVAGLVETFGIRTARQVKVEIEGQTDRLLAACLQPLTLLHSWSSDIFISGFIGILD
jgi:hypothetical protein